MQRNAAYSAAGTLLAQLPVEKFEEAVIKAVKLNERARHTIRRILYIKPVLLAVVRELRVSRLMNIFIYLLLLLAIFQRSGFQTTPFVIMRGSIVRRRWAWEIQSRWKYAVSLVADNGLANWYSKHFLSGRQRKKYIDECGNCNFF